MNKLKFITKEGEPTLKDYKALSIGLLSHHASNGHPRTSTKYSIFLRDSKNKPYAGIIVTFMWNGVHIDSLWVDETLRGQGWGSKLVTMVEEEGLKRGCNIAYTDTFTWQATKFYEKLGYLLYGKLDGFPQGSELSYYFKRLG